MIDINDNFIDKLKRDRARGNLAPHQVILLISFFNLKKAKVNINELFIEFDANWSKYKYLFKSTNKNIGMPLSALQKKDLISISVSEPIDNYKNSNELNQKVKSISLSEELIKFLKITSLSYMESRIRI